MCRTIHVLTYTSEHKTKMKKGMRIAATAFHRTKRTCLFNSYYFCVFNLFPYAMQVRRYLIIMYIIHSISGACKDDLYVFFENQTTSVTIVFFFALALPQHYGDRHLALQYEHLIKTVLWGS